MDARPAGTQRSKELERVLRKSTVLKFDLSDAPTVVEHVAKWLQLDAVDSEAMTESLIAEAALSSSTKITLQNGHSFLPLIAAKHLLALGEYDLDNIDRIVPDTSSSLRTFTGARKTARGRIVAGAGDVDPRRVQNFGLRATIASEASGIGADRTNFSPGKQRIVDVAASVLSKMEALLDQDAILGTLQSRAERLRATREAFAKAHPDAPEVSANQAPAEQADVSKPSLKIRRKVGSSFLRPRRHPVFFTLSGVILISIASGFVWWAGNSSIAVTSDEYVEMASLPYAQKFVDERFWLPANAPIDSLPVADDYCIQQGDVDLPVVEQLQAWLTKYGVPQYAPHRFTIRNIGSTPGLLGVTKVVANGVLTPARLPGFVFNCPTGGGGPIEWTELELSLDSASEATIATTIQPSDYFWLGLDVGETAGIQLELNGEQDFVGTVTATITPVGSSPATVVLPVPTDGQEIQWHGIPADKYFVVQPRSYLDGTTSFACKAPLTTSYVPCDIAEIERTLEQLWGAEALQ